MQHSSQGIPPSSPSFWTVVSRDGMPQRPNVGFKKICLLCVPMGPRHDDDD